MAVPDPLLTALRPGPPALPIEVATSLARSLRPAEDSAAAPAWLLPAQQRSFRRVLAAVKRYRGAILADHVGSGKTYVALAVAAAFNQGRPTACLVPAALLAQWEALAAALGVPVKLGSHEQASRGRLPQPTRGLVVLDESHHFRNRLTRRYANVAPWLLGHPALLVTATPVVNHLSDLANQLLLGVRDNALAIEGIGSLRSLLAGGCAAPALGQLVIESEGFTERKPRRVARISAPPDDECLAVAQAIESLKRLRLSSDAGIAALIRGVLLQAAGSSPAALAASLRRYRRLLLNARDALQSGRAMDRSELRRFTAELGDQLVWWELFPKNGSVSDLELADLVELEAQEHTASAAVREIDPKLERLRTVLADAKPTLVFTNSRDTVRYIRERLGALPLAWCTGDRAGLGRTILPRDIVLGWFREGTESASPVRHLVVTDVAAEGLDLHRAARVVHYDLPWTTMRLDQREGRALRLGSKQQEVEVVRFAPPPVLEQSLRIETTLARKARLPGAAGLGAAGRHVWRWRADLADEYSGTEPVAGTATVLSPKEGLLAGFVLHPAGDPMAWVMASVGWLEAGQAWTEAPEVVTERLAWAASSESLPTNPERIRQWLALLAQVIRERLALTGSRRWVSPDPIPAARKVTRRLNGLIREAARLRQADRLRRLQLALAFAGGGHTAGEAMRLENISEWADRKLESELARFVTLPEIWDELEVRLTGLIVYGPKCSGMLA